MRSQATPTYPDTEAIVKAINTVVRCKPQGGPYTTVYSHRSETCWYRAADGVRDNMTAVIFSTLPQQNQGMNYLLGYGPATGAWYVTGDGWAVITDEYYAPKIAKALGGVVVGSH